MADERAHPIDDERAERQRHHDEEVARLQEVAARTARERDHRCSVSMISCEVSTISCEVSMIGCNVRTIG